MMKYLWFAALISYSTLIMSSCGTTNKTLKNRDSGAQQTDPLTQAIMESRKGNYQKSLDILNSLLEQRNNHPDVLVRRASVYYEMGKKSEALTDFNTVINTNPNYDPEVYYSAGITAMDLNKYAEASTLFNSYITKQKNNPEKVNKAKKLMDTSTFRQGTANESYDINQRPLLGEVNSLNSEYLPALSLDQTRMIFTRRVGGQEDLYISTFVEGKWTEVKEISGVNTDGNEAAHTISSDGKLIIFTACDRKLGIGGCDLFYTKLIDGKWSQPIVMSKAINTPTWEAQPCLSADGRKLFFCSSRVEGNGGHDIWMSEKDPVKGWLPATNLGSEINTKGNEESPYLHPDGKTLYFRSNGHPGMGSFDLFKSTYDRNTKRWSKPENLGPPINTEGDEGALTISLDGLTGYYATDIESINDNNIRNNLNIFQFNVPDHLRPSPVTYIKAIVTDAKTGELLNAKVTITDENNDDSYTELIDNTGEFIIVLPSGNEYTLSVDKPGYKYFLDLIHLSDKNDMLSPLLLNIKLMPISQVKNEETQPIILEHIYFESNSALLSPNSQFEINKLYQLLTDQPSLTMSIIGHTDNVGTENDNLELSQKRANAVRVALLQKGILGTRLTAIGKGEALPLADNETQEGRNKNRRTEVLFGEIK